MTKRVFVALMICVLAVFAMAPSFAVAVCKVEATTTIAPDPVAATTPTVGPLVISTANVPATVNNEGFVERPSDVLVYDDGTAPLCFPSGQVITITYNAALTSADGPTLPLFAAPNISTSTGTFDVYDSAGSAGLLIQATSTVALGPGGVYETAIKVTVTQAGTSGNITTTAAGSAFRLKNLRFNVTALTTGKNVTATVSASVAGTLPAVVTDPVGLVEPTINTLAGQSTITATGSGPQSSNAPLVVQGAFEFVEGFNESFRVAGTAAAPASGVAADLATNDTSLVFNTQNVPSGVTVTFPSTISTSAQFNIAAGSMIFTARAGTTLTNGGAAGGFVTIYDTTANGPGANTVAIPTAAAASPGSLASPPTIGVNIGTNTGFGTATLQAVFGPTVGPAAFPGDDVNASAIPLYVPNVGAGLSRAIFPNTANPTTNWFTITPVRTVLLFQYTTDLFSFATGITVANSGSDSTAFAPSKSTVGETGAITFYFFPSNSPSFSYTTTAGSPGRGLTAGGSLAPGAVYAVNIDLLLSAAGQGALVGSFDGYMIAVCQFNYAHGFSIVFTPTGNEAANPALVIGGGTRCTYCATEEDLL